jgi:cytochrome P450
MLRYLREPIAFAEPLLKKYGDPFTVPTLLRPMVVTASTEGVRAIFSGDPDTFSPFAGNAGIALLGRGSVLLQQGATHRRSRKLMQPPFHGARMRSYGEKMAEIAEGNLKRAPAGRFDIEEVFRRISLEVILATVFGVTEIDKTRESVLAMIRSFSPLLTLFHFLQRRFFPPWRRFQRLMAEVRSLIGAEIDRRKQAPGEDICSLLVAARDEEGNPMDDQEIIDQLVTMVMAGHETTATALAWAVDEVWRQPELLERLRQSLSPEPEKLAADKLLDAVCAETLRIRPLLPIVSRNLEKPFELGGYTIPAGVGVGACIALVHQREDLYPEPHVFKPERFLDGRNFTPHEYFPWGGGARRCLGAAFALYEMKIVLGRLILGGKLELASPARARYQARAATIGPKGGVQVVYTPPS